MAGPLLLLPLAVALSKTKKVRKLATTVYLLLDRRFDLDLDFNLDLDVDSLNDFFSLCFVLSPHLNLTAWRGRVAPLI